MSFFASIHYTKKSLKIIRIQNFLCCYSLFDKNTDMPSFASITHKRNCEAWAYQTSWGERTGTSRGPQTSSSSPGWPGYSLHPGTENYGFMVFSTSVREAATKFFYLWSDH